MLYKKYTNISTIQKFNPLSQTRYSSIGALDLGGASTQIAFETNETVPSQFFKNESLFGVNYNLYARSYLCYGENQAYSRFLAHLINVVHTEVCTVTTVWIVFCVASFLAL